MTIEGLKHIISHSEGTEIEYKRSQTGLARSVYESICAFLNRKGGHVILGADDDGTIVGIDPDKVQEQLDTLARDLNNPQVLNPTFYINFEPMEVDGRHIIYFYVPESSQAHNYKGMYYDRNQDGDFVLENNQQIADLMLRKQSGCSENKVFPHLAMEDFEADVFDLVRKRIALYHPGHLWAEMTNHEILVSAGMWLKDPLTGNHGYTLAAALLFGTEATLRSVAPFFKIDALCRRHNTDLYDNRDIIHCNLIRAYDRLMAFSRQNLPEWPYINDGQRMSLRDVLMREICVNLLIHAEYGSRHDSSLTIWKNRVETVNWNIPYNYGLITLDNLRPHAKNPSIANFFAQLGIVEELGKGTRTMYEYVPYISGGQQPEIEEKDEFKVIIPYVDDDGANIPEEVAIDVAEEPTEGQRGISSFVNEDCTITSQKSTQKSTQKKILEYLTTQPLLSRNDLSGLIGVTPDTIKKHLATLQKKGLLRRVGGRKAGHWEVTTEGKAE